MFDDYLHIVLVGSPSMRREWIEILHGSMDERAEIGLPPCGGSGLKLEIRGDYNLHFSGSPSMRREWIEIPERCGNKHLVWSPSMRREWIEIYCKGDMVPDFTTSPSMRREWIEILV